MLFRGPERQMAKGSKVRATPRRDRRCKDGGGGRKAALNKADRASSTCGSEQDGSEVGRGGEGGSARGGEPEGS